MTFEKGQTLPKPGLAPLPISRFLYQMFRQVRGCLVQSSQKVGASLD